MSAMVCDSTWPEVAGRAAGAVLAVPLGSTEQHGPHLPLSTDTEIAQALCAGLADARADVIVAPALAYGASGEHAGFAGTLSVGLVALESLLVELGRSATETVQHVVFVSAHGGNHAAVSRATATLRAESRDVTMFVPCWDGDAHAGQVETSLMLALRPASVRSHADVIGDVRPLAELMPVLRERGVRAVTANGVLGDPREASAAEGFAILADLVAHLVEHVRGWRATS